MVHADPSCLFGAETGTSGFTSVNAVATGLHVEVRWNFTPAEGAELEGFVIYRGATPSTLRAVARGVSAEVNEYVDPYAMARSDSSWYAVAAVVDGAEVRSQAYLVQVLHE